MKYLQKIFEKNEKHFKKGGKLKKYFPIFEVIYTFLFVPATVTSKDSHIRDFMDLKRLMIIVYIALIPTVIMALYNTGLQANLSLLKISNPDMTGWQKELLISLGIGFNPENILDNIIHGSLYFLPIYFITIVVGGLWESIFAIIRCHEISEGFLVTSLLFPLILPPNIPYWQVALGITFGVVIGKEIFGGVGMNILNPALTGRAFLFFAYPAQISGNQVWIAVDGISQATLLSSLANPEITFNKNMESWLDAFFGFIPGSMGETSTFACIIGAIILIVTGIGSYRIIFGIIFGLIITSLLLNLIGSETNKMFQLEFYWHFVIGGFAFGTVFMATDPVSAAYTNKGRWLYGLLIGFLIVLIRVINPAYPEGVMLAILFANAFSSALDQIFVYFNIKRRIIKYGS